MSKKGKSIHHSIFFENETNNIGKATILRPWPVWRGLLLSFFPILASVDLWEDYFNAFDTTRTSRNEVRSVIVNCCICLFVCISLQCNKLHCIVCIALNPYLGKLNFEGCMPQRSLSGTGPALERFSPRWCRSSSAACQGSVSTICSLNITSWHVVKQEYLKVGMYKVQHHNAVFAPIVAHWHTFWRKPDEAHEHWAWTFERQRIFL